MREPGSDVLEYVTITKDPHSELVVAVGGTEYAADFLQRESFLPVPGLRAGCHHLPHYLTPEVQRLCAIAAWRALRTDGFSAYSTPP